MKPIQSKRIFIAVDIPKGVGNLMPMIKSFVPTPLGEIRWLSGWSLHLTLSFLGDINDEKIPEITDALSQIKPGGPIPVSIENTGLFPDEKNARVLWLGIKKGHQELSDLQKSVDKALLKYKSSGELDNFVPHITIGRVNHTVRPGALDFSMFLNVEYTPIKFTLDNFVLYESQLLPAGAKYTAIKRFTL